MTTHIVAPLNALQYRASDGILYLLVDGLDESEIC